MQLPVYFISDIHLMLKNTEHENEKLKRLSSFFRHVRETGGTLFIVGDLFDFYFEYPHVIPKVYFSFYSEVYYLKQKGIEIHYILGNHDYWVLDFIQDTITNKTYFDDIQFELKGKKFYITHGDGLLSQDKGYRMVKKILRNRFFIWCFRWLHPTLGYRFGNWVSSRSRHYEHSKEYNRRVLEELSQIAENRLNSNIDYFLCGHYHQAVEKNLSNGKLVVLGDWIRFNSYGFFDGESFTLKYWETDSIPG
jgi:UDP-2,3-diacylglucosamine hydrolase